MLICPSCNTVFRVRRDQIGVDGRIVACNKCDYEWLAHVEDIIQKPSNDESINHHEEAFARPNATMPSNKAANKNNEDISNGQKRRYISASERVQAARVNQGKSDTYDSIDKDSAETMSATQMRGNIAANGDIDNGARIRGSLGGIDKSDVMADITKSNDADDKGSAIHTIIIFMLLNIFAISAILGLEYWDVLRKEFPALENLHKAIFPSNSLQNSIVVASYDVVRNEDKHFINFKIVNNSDIYHNIEKLKIVSFDANGKEIAEHTISVNASIYPGMYKNISISIPQDIGNGRAFSLYANNILLIEKGRYDKNNEK